MDRRPLILSLSMMLLPFVCYAQNPHARAIASTIGTLTEDNSGQLAASATAANDFNGPHVAQSHVRGVPAPTVSLPSTYPLYLGAATSNDTGELSGRALSIATANWNDRMTIVSPTVVNQVIFSISLQGSMEVSIKETANPNVFPEAYAAAQLEVYTLGQISRYTAENSIPLGAMSSGYETSMSENVTATSVDYTNPDNNGTRIHYLLPVRNNVIDFEVTLKAISQTNNGVANSLFSDTAILSNVFLADGTTPESHGMILVFDSGVPSPNIVVPEVGSITLLGPGLIGVITIAILKPLRRNGA